MSARRPAPRRSRGRRRRGRAALIVLLLAGAAAYVLLGGGPGPAPAGDSTTGGTRADDVAAVDDLVDNVVERPDGSVAVTVTEAETASLVAAGLERSQAPTLRDVAVDLVAVDEGSPGRMIVSGRLQDRPVPVRATVDLEVVDSSVRPTVRDVRIGPLGLPASIRRDLTRELRQQVTLADPGIAVSQLHTTDTTLELTGRAP